METSTKPTARVGKFSQARFDELKTTHGRILRLANKDVGVEVLCKPLDTPSYFQLQDALENKAKARLAGEQILRMLIVEHDPDFSGVNDMLATYPALADSFIMELMRLAGGGLKSSVGEFV